MEIRGGKRTEERSRVDPPCSRLLVEGSCQGDLWSDMIFLRKRGHWAEMVGYGAVSDRGFGDGSEVRVEWVTIVGAGLPNEGAVAKYVATRTSLASQEPW